MITDWTKYNREYMRKRRKNPLYAAMARAYARDYGAKHRAKISEQQNARRQNPRKKIEHALRERVRAAVSGRTSKAARTMELVGCTIDQFLGYLEIQFQDGMSWANYGQWHIDHKKPCAAFDLTDPAQQKQCFNYSNQQPLWAQENLSKSSKFETIL